MRTNLDNPFANYGCIVNGDKFIGRREVLKDIENRIIRPSDAGNLAIIGLPRVGKSSLAYKALVERKKELFETKKLLIIWVSLATFNQASDLFCFLVNNCKDEMKELNCLSKPISELTNRILNNKFSLKYNYELIRQFFLKIRQAGYRVVCILDEFDFVRYLFKDDILSFQRLRELSYNPEWKVNFVLTSRRSIRDLEVQSAGVSTFDGIFHKIYLKMFNENDLDEYFNRLITLGIQVNHEIKNRILFFCGGYPYLLGMFAYEIIEDFLGKGGFNLDEVTSRIGQSIINHYDRIVSLLKEDDSFNKLLQILFGPVFNLNQTDIDEFTRYGLIKLINQNYTAFSGHFNTLLQIIEREVDLWPLFKQTEKALRKIISEKMLEKYGDYWTDELEKKHPNLKNLFSHARESQNKEKMLFSDKASHNLIDYTYPVELFSIIFAEWNLFSSIFGKDKTYWDLRAQLLGKIRNPLAHNRDEQLYEDMRLIAEGYCKEILRIIKS
jgi:hypothetical protein